MTAAIIKRWSALEEGVRQLDACASECLEDWQLGRIRSLLAHHWAAPGPYGDHLETFGVEHNWLPRSLEEFQRIPVVDKAFIRFGEYADNPTTTLPVTVVATSGTTSAAVRIPHTAESLQGGLGDNFGRAYICSGIGLPTRPWMVGHWAESSSVESVALTGSYLSMAWLDELLAHKALLQNGLSSMAELVLAASKYRPHSLASAPNLLTSLARSALSLNIHFEFSSILYGGAAATDAQRSIWREAFSPIRIIGFFPTTDAGAIGVSIDDSGRYVTFSETHLVEVVDDQGQPVQEGERGDLVVTAYRSLAAPLIRYRIGDQVTFEGIVGNRVVVSGIRRRSEASIGDTLVPLADIDAWTTRLRDAGFDIEHAQLVCRTSSDGRDLPIVRVVSGVDDPMLARAALRLLEEQAQLVHEIRHGGVSPATFEVQKADTVLRTRFKLPSFVDERDTHRGSWQ